MRAPAKRPLDPSGHTQFGSSRSGLSPGISECTGLDGSRPASLTIRIVLVVLLLFTRFLLIPCRSLNDCKGVWCCDSVRYLLAREFTCARRLGGDAFEPRGTL